MQGLGPEVFDDRPCELGEGAFWHPEKQALFWFDISAQKLLWRGAAESGERDLPERASAAARLGGSRLLLGATRGLIGLDLVTGATETLCAFAETAALITNDGRADPWGGFWISRMAPDESPGAGEIWRWHQGQFRRIVTGLTIPNAICFDAARARAYWADTLSHRIMVQPLDAEGWPIGAEGVFLDLSATESLPDGAVTDACGNLWVAIWGEGRVICVDPRGKLCRSEGFAARQTSCPAFGGVDLSTLFVTSAYEGMSAADRSADPLAGRTFAREMGSVDNRVIGRAEPLVRLQSN